MLDPTQKRILEIVLDQRSVSDEVIAPQVQSRLDRGRRLPADGQAAQAGPAGRDRVRQRPLVDHRRGPRGARRSRLTRSPRHVRRGAAARRHPLAAVLRARDPVAPGFSGFMRIARDSHDHGLEAGPFRAVDRGMGTCRSSAGCKRPAGPRPLRHVLRRARRRARRAAQRALHGRGHRPRAARRPPDRAGPDHRGRRAADRVEVLRAGRIGRSVLQEQLGFTYTRFRRAVELAGRSGLDRPRPRPLPRLGRAAGPVAADIRRGRAGAGRGRLGRADTASHRFCPTVTALGRDPSDRDLCPRCVDTGFLRPRGGVVRRCARSVHPRDVERRDPGRPVGGWLGGFTHSRPGTSSEQQRCEEPAG